MLRIENDQRLSGQRLTPRAPIPKPPRSTPTDEDWWRETQALEEGAAVLARAVELLDRGQPSRADRLLTAALMGHPRDGDLWLAAGVARLRRGRTASARAALRMCVWLNDDPVATELLAVSSSRS